MDAFSDPLIHTVVVMSSAQVGKTEILNNVVGFHVDQDPSPMLILQPTIDMGQAWSKDRLAPMVRDTDTLRSKIADVKSRDSGNTMLHKKFPGGHLTIAGANSAASLASRPIRVMLADEVDRFPASAGTEGDPVNLARKRTTAFWNRKVGLFSTPTVKGLSRIEVAYEESDQRRFFVECPHCQAWDFLRWANVQWTEPADAAIVCEDCGGLFTENQRQVAIRNGEWRGQAPFNGVAGFHLNELYSPWRLVAEIVSDFLAAKKNPERLKTFINTSLGETWEEAGETVEPHAIAQRREPYTKAPEKVVVITAGLDVQDDRIECEAVGWNGSESWGLDYQVFHGNPGNPELWQRVDDWLMTRYEREDGVKLPIHCACIDTGGHYTDQTYKFIKPRERRRVFGIKGMAGTGKAIISRPSNTNKGKIKLFTVGVDTAKELLLLSRLSITQPGPGYCHFPASYDDEYFEQLTAEKAVTKYSKGFPKREWVKTRPRNEALDCRVYAMAALEILNPNFEKIIQRQQPTEEPEPPKPEAQPVSLRRQQRRPMGGGFVNGWKT